MRTGLSAGLIAAGTVLLLNLGHALGNADFIYMCAGAALLDAGRLPVTPYFPPGYPALLWLVTQTGLLAWPGMTALHAGTLLSAIGTGLSAGALAHGARLLRVPPGPALLLGLLGVSLPSLAEIALNPHVDPLFTGLALCLIVGTLGRVAAATAPPVPPTDRGKARTTAGPTGKAAVKTSQQWPLLLGLALCALLLLTLRWHAVLIVAPCMLLLLFTRSSRAAGVVVMLAALGGAGWGYWGLWVTYGGLPSAAPLQVATGAVYREYGPGRESEAAAAIFGDYAVWVQSAPPVARAVLADAVRANWPQFVSRKAVLAGLALWLLALLVYRRWPPQSHWLLLFILGYPLAVGTTYFTPRASALVELIALLLAASALSVALTQDEHELARQKLARRRLHFKPNAPSLRLDPALVGSLFALACLLGMGYNLWRVQRDIRAPLLARQAEERAVYAAALAAVDGDAAALAGRLDRLPAALHQPWGLPGPSYTRLWLDDPRMAGMLTELLPRAEDDPGISAVLIWRGDEMLAAKERELAALPAQWRRKELGSGSAALWRRIAP